MGHSSISDLVSRQNIKEGEHCIAIILSKDTSQKDGRLTDSNILYNNQLWEPASLPIFGDYNGYGSLDDIIKTPSVLAMEENLNLPINTIIQLVGNTRDFDSEYSPVYHEAKLADSVTLSKWKNLQSQSLTFTKTQSFDFMTSFYASEYNILDDFSELKQWFTKTFSSMFDDITNDHAPDLESLESQLDELVSDPSNNFTKDMALTILSEAITESNKPVPSSMQFKNVFLNIGFDLFDNTEIVQEFFNLYKFESNISLANIFWTPTYSALQDGGNHVTNALAKFISENLLDS